MATQMAEMAEAERTRDLELAAQLSAVAHPVRLQILRELRGPGVRTRSPKQLADGLGVPLGRLAYHVRELLRAEMVVLVRTEPRRGAMEHFYQLTPAARVRLRQLKQVGV